MKILLVSATQKEIEPFIIAYPKHLGIDILISGVGIANTIYHVQKKLCERKYDLIIQAGIAGTFTDKIELGEVVTISQDTFGDMGAEEKENFATIFEMNLADKNEFPFTNGWLINDSNYLNQGALKKVKSITVNKISDKKLQIDLMVQKFNADVESMEGAAFHFVCLQEKIPFIQIRSISNYVGERDKSKWKIKEAIENLNNNLKKIIVQIINNY